jgi:prepilin-type N-terminal cleavage/methylation domain-containing protein
MSMNPFIKMRASLNRAYTLVEIMVSMTIFSLVVLGVLSSNIFGLRLYEVAKTKLGVNESSRRALSMMITDIREAKFTSVGTGSATTFVEPVAGVKRQGNALQINPLRDNTNVFIRYFRDDDQSIKMVTDTNATPVVVADYVSNSVVFAEEDFRGAVLTNRQASSVIALNLRFFKIEFPAVPVGQGGFYEFYSLQTRITRRSAE